MKDKGIKLIKFFLGWPLSLIALFFIWKVFTPHLSQIQMYGTHANVALLLAGFLSFQLYFILRVFLWQQILKTKGHHVSIKDTAWYWSIAEVNRYIPGTIWSIVGRGALFSKFGIKQSVLFTAWAQESFLVMIGSAIVGATGLSLLVHSRTLYVLAITFILLILLIWIFQKRLQRIRFIPKIFQKVFIDQVAAGHLAVLSIGSFLFFGFGSYLSVRALFFLPFQDILSLIGLFSLSFAIGYVSFITPMGLGVRELAMSEGLLTFLPRSIVGFASIFARVALILSELLFLFFAYIWFRLSAPIVTKWVTHVKDHIYAYLLGLSMGMYAAYFTTVSFLRYTNFFTGRFDLGNMDQTVWNSLHGKIFMLTDPNGTSIMSRLGTHADFILVLLAPFYLLWEDPRMLLLIQTLVLVLGALFVYLIAKNALKRPSVAFVLALAYLLNPSVQYTNLYDFHPVTLATTFFLGAWYFLKKKKYAWTLLFLLLAGVTKEEAWIVVGLFGLYFFFFEKKRALGAVLSALSFAAFYALIWKFIPHARGGQHFALSYYADFGSTPTGIIKNMFFSPLKTGALIFNKPRLIYLSQLFFPLGFFPLVVPFALIFALPDLGINLLSSNTQLQQVAYQYTAVITPFLFIASISSLRYMIKKIPRTSSLFFASIILVCTIVSAYLYGPLPGAIRPEIDVFTRQETDKAIIEGFLNDIPASFSVAATNNIGSHLSHRQNIYTVPVGIDRADVVVFLLNDQFAQPSLSAQKEMAEKMKHDKNYIEVFKENDFIVFEKRNLYTKHEPTIQKGKLYPAAIETLEHRDFEGGKIVVQKIINQTPKTTTLLFSYPSDGLTLFARADMPSGSSTFPVVIINRGYVTSSTFQEETSYENISQAFAENGFVAITPNYRNNGESDKDSSIAGILGNPIDVLNLVNSLPSLAQADTKHVFLWGYSIGGQITLSTLIAWDQNKNIIPTIQAASLWAPVIDQYSAYANFHSLFPNQRVPYQRVYDAFGPFSKNSTAWESVSPLFYLDDETTPVRIVHGLSDTINPYEWSVELYAALKSYHNNATITLYAGANHNFTNTWQNVVRDDITYFTSFLHK